MDHEVIGIRQSSISCGVLELTRVGTEPEKAMFALGAYLYHPSKGQPAAFGILSDVVGEVFSYILVKIMRNMGFIGIITMFDYEINFKIGNTIYVGVFALFTDLLRSGISTNVSNVLRKARRLN